MRLFCTTALVLGLFTSLMAQIPTPNFWTPVAQEAIVLPATAQRSIQPTALVAFQLDYTALETALKQAPMEFTRAAREQALLLELPMADGAMRSFKVVESPIMAPELSAKFPAIHTYSGIATDGSGMFVRLGVGYKGFHAFIFGDQRGSSQSLRPYAEGQNNVYMAYKVSDLPNDPALEAQLTCGTDDFESYLHDDPAHSEHTALAERGAEPKPLKIYRAAIAAQGEYSIFNGGTKPLVLSAIVEAMNYINAILERDFGVRHQLVANNDQIIYLDPATDPYTGENDLASWLAQNPSAINPVIGINSYDMGHAFCQTGAGGVIGKAALASVCDVLRKGQAASSWFTPNNEKFYLTAAHEMCHQLSGTHTFSNCPPNADATSPETAFEPGGGSTIMAYTSACGSQNFQNDEDPYYHNGNVVQALNFVAVGGGSQCGETVATDNNTPTASTNIPAIGLYIPISTPFVLTGSGSDPDGDALTYCWEQLDLGPTSPLGSPSGNTPTFRSYLPISTPNRTCPRIQTVISNNPSPVEVLPTYNRQLTFRLTVRDNHVGAGGVDWVEVKMQATTTAGPFLVTYPNELITWNVGENQIVTWNVANTDGPLW